MFVASKPAGCASVRRESCAPASFAAQAPSATSRNELIRPVYNVYRVWRTRSEERRQLAEMSEQEMRDIGVTRWDVIREINKPFWR
jgi:uncharacterized protein YjiS (DUF1127 family)